MFVYFPNTSHFIHFQSVRQKKLNIHNKTNKYRYVVLPVKTSPDYVVKEDKMDVGKNIHL